MTNFGALSVNPLVEAIKNKLVRFVSDELSLTANFKSDLEQIKNKLEDIRALLEDAETRSLSEDSRQLQLWLKRIKEAAYDMEDLMEDIRMGPYPPEIAAAMSKGISDRFIRKIVLRTVSFCSPVTSRLCLWPGPSSSDPKALEFQWCMGHRMKDVSKSLDDILNERSTLDLIISRPRSHLSTAPMIVRPETFSAVDESTVLGRDEEKKEIINFILKSEDASASSSNANEKNIRVIAVVGMGGLGKTTLARLVYNDKRIKESDGSFDIFLWVSVPVEFEMKAILKAIFINCGIHGNTDNLQYMSTRVQDHLGGKKVFLVMDDVWNEDPNAWSEFRAIIKNCKRGSIILVTTRSKRVSKCVKADHNIELKGLSSEDSWKLFCSKAFNNDEEMQICSHLHDIGKDIIEICCGVPLAINAVGAILSRSKSLEYWTGILTDQNNIWKRFDGNLNDEKKVMYSLNLTFLMMSSELKRCFIYCSFFPKRSFIYKNELIYQWMAMGYTATYDAGEIQFQSLLSMCFLQKENFYKRTEDYYIMHDIARDLAEITAGEEIIFSHAENLNISEICRCLFIDGIFQKEMIMMKETKLRALHVGHSILDSFETTFEDMRYLRALIISRAYYIKPLPASLRISRHLRYLEISFCRVKEIPDFIWELGNLQFLNMTNNFITSVPEHIGNLTSLQFLDMSENIFDILPEGIGNLTSLQFLDFSRCRYLRLLPDSIGRLEKLRILDLSYCVQLERIPESAGTMRNLHRLSLKECSNLSGLPESLGDLENLKILN